MPDIVGYWTGSKVSGVWQLTPQPGQLFIRYSSEPTEIFPKCGARIKGNVNKATAAFSSIGYNLAWRPNTPAYKAAVDALTKAYAANPVGDMSTLDKNIKNAIDAAVTATKINPTANIPPLPDEHSHDTGFDIEPKPGDPWYPGPG